MRLHGDKSTLRGGLTSVGESGFLRADPRSMARLGHPVVVDYQRFMGGKAAGNGRSELESLEIEVLNQLFESLLLELGDAEKIFRLLERRVFAGFDDVICEEITDSGQAHEVVASGGVRVDFFAWLEFLITDGEIDLIVILALCFALDGEFFPIRLGPDAKPAFGGLEFEVIERIFILLCASVTGAVGIDAECTGEAGFDKLGGEVGAVRAFHKGVNAPIFGIAECVAKAGVDCEGFFQEHGGFLCGCLAKVFGDFDGLGGFGCGFRDAKIPALGAESAGV